MEEIWIDAQSLAELKKHGSVVCKLKNEIQTIHDVKLIEADVDLTAEIERLNQALTWEQNRSGRIGTHGPGCHTWGDRHYECLLRVNQELLEALRAARHMIIEDESPIGWSVDRVSQAIAKAQP